MHNILLIDDEPQIHDIIIKIFKKDDIRISSCHSVDEAIIEFIEKAEVIDLIILDFHLPDGTGLDIIETLNIEERKIPVIIITSGWVDKIPLYEEGVISFIRKPLDIVEFRYNVLNLLKLETSRRKIEEFKTITMALARALETRDSYTEGHSTRVWEFSVILYTSLGLEDKEDLRALKVGCFLHDLGKIGIPDSILKSDKALTKEEYEIVKKHSSIGSHICEGISGIEGALDIIRHHHEKLDGSGYPDGLKGTEISLLVRIVSIADIFDALTSKRAYRTGNNPHEAVQILKKEAKEGLLDEYLVDKFVDIVEPHI